MHRGREVSFGENGSKDSPAGLPNVIESSEGNAQHG